MKQARREFETDLSPWKVKKRVNRSISPYSAQFCPHLIMALLKFYCVAKLGKHSFNAQKIGGGGNMVIFLKKELGQRCEV